MLYPSKSLIEAFEETQRSTNEAFTQLNATLQNIDRHLESLSESHREIARAKMMRVELEIAIARASGLDVPFET